MSGQNDPEKISAAPETPSEPSLGAKVMHGMLWTLAMRWMIRGLGTVSTLILARLLQPADFGLVAMAMVLVELANVMLDFGVEWVLIQNHKAERRHYDTAWTVRIIQNAIVGAGIALITPLAVYFYDEPRMAWILPLLGLSIFVRGFENIGIVKFQKEMTFRKDFQYYSITKLVWVGCNIGLAFWLRSYLALILTQLIATILTILLSYVFSSYRPRFSLAAFKEIWGYSQWNMVRGLANYINNAGDRLIIGKSLGPTDAGYYTVGKEVANMATTELVAPLSRALTPGFAKVKDDPERLRNIFFEAMSGVAYLAMPVGLGIFAAAPEIVPIALGQKWAPMIGLTQLLALTAVLYANGSIAGNLAVVHGYVRWIAIATWIQAGLSILLLWPALHYGGLLGLAALKVALTGVNVYLCMCILVWRENYRWRDIFAALIGPLLSSMTMMGGLIFGEIALLGQSVILAPLLGHPQPVLPVGVMVLHMVAKMIGGAAIYALAAFLFWCARGRPPGLEERALGVIAKSTRTLRKRALGIA